MLLIETDDHLRLDRSVSQSGDDRLLNFGQGARGGGNLTGIGHINAALLIDGLRRQIDEVAGTRASSLPRCEQTAWSGLEDRDVQHVADASDLLRLRPLVGEF